MKKVRTQITKNLNKAAVTTGMFFLLAGETAYAAGGAMDLIPKAINLGVLILIIFIATRKPIGRFLSATAQEVKTTFEGARTEAANTAKELAEQKTLIEGMSQELSRMTADAKEDAAKELVELNKAAKEQAGRIQENSEAQIEREISRARTELRKQVAGEAVKIAEELVLKEMNPTRQEKMVKVFTQQMENRS